MAEHVSTEGTSKESEERPSQCDGWEKMKGVDRAQDPQETQNMATVERNPPTWSSELNEQEVKQLDLSNAKKKIRKLSMKLRRARKDLKQASSEKKKLESKVTSLETQVMELSQQLEKPHKSTPSAASVEINYREENIRKEIEDLQCCNKMLIAEKRRMLESPECPRPQCANLQQMIKEKQELIQKFNPMREIGRHQNGEQDKYILEYKGLMSRRDGILGQLQRKIEPAIEAKRILGNIFMAAYEESKKRIIDLVAGHFHELFVLQEDEEDEEVKSMNDLSRAFSLLIHCTAARSEQIRSTIIPEICEKIKHKIQELQKEEEKELPIEHVVEVAWKFVTSPNPIVVCQPEKYDEYIHTLVYDHDQWAPVESQPYSLIYVRPVVYRSYRGILEHKGLVANKTETSSS